MFLVTKPKALKKIQYDPELIGGSIRKTKNKMPSFKKSLFFMQEILQNPHLSIDEAFSPSCVQLLNLVNVLRPTRKNKVIKTSSRPKQRKGNLLEFLGAIQKSNYIIRDFPITDYLKGETSAQRQMALITLHLQSEYEKNGKQPTSEKEIRTFLVFEGSLEQPNKDKTPRRVVGINPFLVSKKSLDLFQNSKICEIKNIFSHSLKSIKQFVKLRSIELGHPLSEVSPKKKKKKKNDNSGWDLVDIQNIGEDEDFPSKNKKNKKKNYSPKKRSKQPQFDSSDDGFGSSPSSQYNSHNSSNDESSQDFDDLLNNQQGFNFPTSDSNSDSSQESESESESDQYTFSLNSKRNSSIKKQIQPSKFNSDNSSSNIASYQNSDSSENINNFDKSDNYEYSEDSDISDNFSKKQKKQKNSKSRSHKSNNKKNKSNKKQFSSARKYKNYNNNDSDSGSDNSSISNSKINVDTNENENYGVSDDSSNNNSSSNSDESDHELNAKKHTPKKHKTKNNKRISKSTPTTPLPSKRKQEQKKIKKISVPLEISPYEGSHAIIPLFLNKANIYLKKEIWQIFQRSTKNKYKKQIIKSPKTRAYLYLIFYLINTLDNWKKNSKTKSDQFSKKYGFDVYQQICKQGYQQAKDLGKNGCAILQVKMAKGNHRNYKSGVIELNKRDLLLKYSLNQERPTFKLSVLKEPFQMAVKKRDPSEISIIKESMKKGQRDQQFKIKFDEEIKAIHGLMTIMYFYNTIHKNKNSKNSGIGQNPVRIFERPIEELVGHVMPPLAPPNTNFNKLLSGVKHIDAKEKPKNILLKYMIDGGVNFLVAVVNEKEFPLSPGFLKIRKNKMKIGIGKSVAYTVPWKSRPEIKKNQENSNFFVIEWTHTATCSTTTVPSVTIVCTRLSERSLITRTIIHFYSEWKKSNIKD
ncbi:ankyrin repeat domain-containing protein [Anaeramoeba flamelloides]|uniref:Ankyrin repeat domain-containing protein n=1 Tax=Anaeramoeba flamelloides TaxID=1746091 RepID=A0AAV7YLY7_9EUKA|nr:ankyrin repeat domain-containing protein [Anaeramoeba flamelloides]